MRRAEKSGEESVYRLSDGCGAAEGMQRNKGGGEGCDHAWALEGTPLQSQKRIVAWITSCGPGAQQCCAPT